MKIGFYNQMKINRLLIAIHEYLSLNSPLNDLCQIILLFVQRFTFVFVQEERISWDWLMAGDRWDNQRISKLVVFPLTVSRCLRQLPVVKK